MRRTTILALAALGALWCACRVKVPHSNSQDGAEGDFPCERSDECPAATNACLLSMCMDGQCVFVPSPQGTLPSEDQHIGDCKQLYCDGDGEILSHDAQHDLPPYDHNPCTKAVCDLDIPKHLPKVAGTVCNEAGICNGTGKCGVCLPKAKRCKGAAVATCNADGQWDAPAVCQVDKPLCSQARCIGVTTVAVGGAHGCARFEDGSLRCWGANQRGQLGDGGLPSSQAPGWVSGFASVSFGARHACGLRRDGTVWCWGANDFGQLGSGSFLSTNAPSATGIVATSVAVGDSHSCALTAAGGVLCWGRSDRGQLGSGRAPAEQPPSNEPPQRGKPRATPRLIDGLDDAAGLSLASDHSCVLRNSGANSCWGLRPFALPPPIETPEPDPRAPARPQAPDPVAERKKVAADKPIAVPKLRDAAQIACGAEHCCTRMRDGSVRCWGAGDRGQLGAGPTKAGFSPVTVPGVAGARHIALGRRFGCALLDDQSVACWGANDRGQLGTGSEAPSGRAGKISTIGPARTLHVGDAFACVWLTDTKLYCWGDNALGQLGAPSPAMIRQPRPLVW